MADKLEFYDVKSKKKFSSSEYTIEVRSGRRFAVATSPHSGIQSYRVIGR